MEKRNMESQS